MELSVWFINAFTSERFRGNPAAVIPVASELSVELMLAIAAENRLSETAFIVPVAAGRYAIRWFTPRVEVPLCGHATLASAWVVLNRLAPELQRVTFDSQSGPLHVERRDKRLVLDFPLNEVGPQQVSGELTSALGAEPLEVYSGRQWLIRYSDEATVRELRPNFAWLEATGVHGFIVTAPGDTCDFVSRYFAPKVGVPEDPVTGSAHTYLVPYWAKRLGKSQFTARQISARGGELWCELAGDRVRIAGEARLYLEGKVQV
jgi:PhzF family phenazine biosynthesis protein